MPSQSTPSGRGKRNLTRLPHDAGAFGPDILTISIVPIDTSEINADTPLSVSSRIIIMLHLKFFNKLPPSLAQLARFIYRHFLKLVRAPKRLTNRVLTHYIYPVFYFRRFFPVGKYDGLTQIGTKLSGGLFFCDELETMVHRKLYKSEN